MCTMQSSQDVRLSLAKQAFQMTNLHMWIQLLYYLPGFTDRGSILVIYSILCNNIEYTESQEGGKSLSKVDR